MLVEPGEAVVITRFGDPVRVLTRPGLGWRLPTPLKGTTQVDLCLRTTTSGMQDLKSRDGLRLLMQAYAWKVSANPGHIRQFLRALGNQPNEAAEQLRSFIGSALQSASKHPVTESGPCFTTAARLRVYAGPQP